MMDRLSSEMQLDGAVTPDRDRIRVSGTGLAGGRHGQGARRQFEVCAQTFAEADAALGEPLSELIFNGPRTS